MSIDIKENNEICKLILEHRDRYPLMQIADYFKLLHHRAFGCEHAVASYLRARDYLVRESESVDGGAEPLVESLGVYSRVHLSCLKTGLSPDTLAAVFFISARPEADGRERLTASLGVLRRLVGEGALGFSLDELDARIGEWERFDYSALHHSDAYRHSYSPAYRVLLSEYAELLPIFAKIDASLAAGEAERYTDSSAYPSEAYLREKVDAVYGVLLHNDIDPR